VNSDQLAVFQWVRVSMIIPVLQSYSSIVLQLPGNDIHDTLWIIEHGPTVLTVWPSTSMDALYWTLPGQMARNRSWNAPRSLSLTHCTLPLITDYCSLPTATAHFNNTLLPATAHC